MHKRLPDRTIMVVMPHGWKGGFFRVAAALCNALDEMEYAGSSLRVVLGVPAGYECTERYLLNDNIEVENIEYDITNVNDRRFVRDEEVEFLGDLPLVTPARTLPYGDTSLIGEIDAYILLSALFFEGVFVSTKPYAVYVADMIQRYVPAIYSDASTGYDAPPWRMDRNQRAALKKAHCVFTTTPQTSSDVLTYGGVKVDNVMMFPMFAIDIADHAVESNTGPQSRRLMDLATKSDFSITPGSYFLWVTNASAHKNHINAIRALKHYYESLGGSLKCLICGPVTEMLIPGTVSTPYHNAVYAEVTGWRNFNQNIKIIGYTSDETYLSLLSNAKFLWHNVLYDNGTFSILEAATVGTPSLSSNYPQVRYIDERFHVGSTFFDPRNPIEAAKGLSSMEKAVAGPAKLKKGRIAGGSGVAGNKDLKHALAELLDRLFSSAKLLQAS